MWHVALLVVAGAEAGPGVGYEDRLIERSLAREGRVREPSPAGKVIEEIVIVREDVFAEGDPWPNALNYIHVMTREDVVRRDVLFAAGEVWDEGKAAETERVLRRLIYIAVARVVPVQGKNGGIGVVVVTKDRVSLRPNSFFVVVGDILQVLLLRPSEWNFLGRGQKLVVEFLLYLDTLQISETFVEPRLFGTKLSLFEFAGVVLNRQTGAPEGTVGDVHFGRPLTTIDQRWSFDVGGNWTLKTQRTFCGRDVCLEDGVKRIYDVRQLRAEASVTRTFGTDWQAEVTGTLGGFSNHYEAPATATPREREVLVEKVLPRSEDATYVAAFVKAYQNDFRILTNVHSYDLTEDFQLGPMIQLGARWAIPTVSATHFVEVGGAARYRVLIGEDLLSLSTAAAVRFLPGGGEPVNRRWALEVLNASPPFEGGRLITRLLIDVVQFDQSRRIQLLGGASGLRGAPAESIAGRNLALLNVEYRARSFEFQTLYIGLVLFYDAGSAFDAQSTFAVTHTMGVGLRIVVPQWGSDTIRFDFGFVLGGTNTRLSGDSLVATYGQVTDLRPVFLDFPLGGGCDSPSCK